MQSITTRSGDRADIFREASSTASASEPGRIVTPTTSTFGRSHFRAISAVCSGSGEKTPRRPFGKTASTILCSTAEGRITRPSGARLGNLPVQASMATLTPSRANFSIWIAARASTAFLLMVTLSPFGSRVNRASWPSLGGIASISARVIPSSAPRRSISSPGDSIAAISSTTEGRGLWPMTTTPMRCCCMISIPQNHDVGWFPAQGHGCAGLKQLMRAVVRLLREQASAASHLDTVKHRAALEIGALDDTVEAMPGMRGRDGQTDLFRPKRDRHRADCLRQSGKLDRQALIDLQDGLAPSVADHLAAEQVGVTNEIGDEARAWPVVNIGRCADLLDLAGIHHRDPVGHGKRFFLIVGDEDHGQAEFALQLLQLELHRLPQLLVERAERFVAKQHPWFDHDGAGQGDALLLPPGELAGAAILVSDELHLCQRIGDLASNRGAVHAAHAQTEGNVFTDRAMRKQCIVLEYHSHVALVRRHMGDIGPTDLDDTFGRRLEAGDHSQCRRLAAAGGAEQREEFSLPNAQIDGIDGARVAVIGLGDGDNVDTRAHARKMRLTRESISSLRALYHFQSGWISVATFSGVVRSFSLYLSSSFTLLLAGEYQTASASVFCTLGLSM